MRLLRTAALLLACFVFATAQDSKLVSEYDRFKDLTTVASQYEHIRFSNAPSVRFVQLRAVFNHKGKTLRTPPAKVTFGFMVTSYEWQFKHTERPSFIVLVDDKKIFDGNAETIDFTVGSGYVMETEAIELEREIVKQMASAKTVEIQLGTLEMSLTSANQQSLREIIAKSQP